MTAEDRRLRSFVRAHLAVNLAVVCITAIGSYGYFHIDEYFQIVEFVRFKLGQVDASALPWEYGAHMRSWIQPGVYVLVARALGAFGVTDPFALALAFRLLTGVLCWASLRRFVGTGLGFFHETRDKRAFVRLATLLGFLPYLFVRTSSEAASMAAFTAGWAVLLEGAPVPVGRPRVTTHEHLQWHERLSVGRLVVGGALLGVAFEARFQTALLTLGAAAWFVVVGRLPHKRLGPLAAGFGVVVALEALVDRWGYGQWTFPPLVYFQTNLLEGAAALFGETPPFSYLWLLPANVFAPVVVAMLVGIVIGFARERWHPITWTTLPFVVVHNLLAHKEERFLFPAAILATGLVAASIATSHGRTSRWAEWIGRRIRGPAFKLLVAYNFAMMAILAVWPVGWNHHVRFQRAVFERMGDTMRVHALPEFDLGLPAFHGRVYDVDKRPAVELAALVDRGEARGWLIVDGGGPSLPLGRSALRLEGDAAVLADRATLVWSELPGFGHPTMERLASSLTARYDAHVRPPLQPLHYRTLYRLHRVGEP